MTGHVTLRRLGAVGEILIDRPAKHNAITPTMFEEFAAVAHEVDSDDAIRCAVLAGAGERAFSAGTDVNTLKDYDGFWAWRNRIDYVTQIRNIRKPVVAALKGWVLGGGLELAVACDLRVAATDAVFAAPEVTLGWIGAGGASQFLPKLIGYGQAMRLLLTGERVSAAEAHRIGLVEELVAPGTELTRAHELAERIAAFSPIATQAVKAAVRAGMNGSLELGLRIENELMALCFAAGNDRSGAEIFGRRKGSV